MMKTIKIIAIAVALLVAAFLVGRCSAPRITPESQVVERVDTMIICDTILREKPIYYAKYISVTDTIRIVVHDTVVVSVPREMRVYKDSLYRAEVSGIEPSLDRIEVYPKTVVISKTETTTQTIANRNNLALGVEASYCSALSLPIYLEYERMLHKNIGITAGVFYDFPTRLHGVSIGINAQIGW